MGQEGQRRVPWCERVVLEWSWWFTADAKPANQTDQVRFLCDGAGLGVSGRLPLFVSERCLSPTDNQDTPNPQVQTLRIRKRGLESQLLRSEASSIIGKRLRRAIRTEPDLRNRLHLHTPQHGPGAKTASFQSTTQPLCHRSNNIQDVGAARDRQGTGTAF